VAKPANTRFASTKSAALHCSLHFHEVESCYSNLLKRSFSRSILLNEHSFLKIEKRIFLGLYQFTAVPPATNELKILRGKRETLSQGFYSSFAILIRLVYVSDSQLLA
jgi:hypothetical protein